ncbi:MAG: hypothetical protein ABJC09_01325 [Terriglobia bacterium]
MKNGSCLYSGLQCAAPALAVVDQLAGVVDLLRESGGFDTLLYADDQL